MIQAMKKDEDDKLDEEADIMREMEMEEAGIVMPKKPQRPEIQVEDSQAPMPLGPDRGMETEEDEEEQPELGPDGKPRRVWKKKGLKRQTRRVISESLNFENAICQTNVRQCDPTSQNLSLSQLCRYTMTRRLTKKAWQRRKQTKMQEMTQTRTAMCLIMPVTLPTHRGSATSQKRN